MYFAQPGFPRPFRQKQIPSSHPKSKFLAAILYIPNMLANEEEESRERALLDEVCSLSRWPVHIKMHPHSSQSHKDAILQIPNLHLVSSTFPAELIIAELRNSIILSPWSTALIIDKPDCRFYWLADIIQQKKEGARGLVVNNPTTHITELENVYQLKKAIKTIQDAQELRLNGKN